MKLPRMSGLEVIRVLNKAGFKEARQKGSHIILTKETIPEGKRGVIVPNHKEIDKGTLEDLSSIMPILKKFTLTCWLRNQTL